MSTRQPHSVLVYPPIDATADALRIWTTSFSTNFPLGLLRLARYLREQKGHRVSLIDAFLPSTQSRVIEADNVAELARPERKVRDAPMGNFAVEGRSKPVYRIGLTQKDLSARLRALSDVDHIYVSSIFTWSWRTTHETVELCRKAHPNATIHLGGVYPTLCPEKAAQCGADDLHVGDLPELDDVSPDLEITGRQDIEASILKTSVGCPNACTYCAVSLLEGRKMRFRDPESVIREVHDTYKKHGVQEYHFWESNLLLKAESHFIPMMDGLIESGLPLRFLAPEGVQTNLINDRIAQRMFRSGFREVFLALETVDEEWGKRTGRPTGFTQLLKAVDTLKRAGFKNEQLVCVLLVGQPWQTRTSILKDILSVYSLGLTTSLLIYTLIPGTVEFERHPELVAERPLEDLDPLLFPFASPQLQVSDLEQIIQFFNFRTFPLERIKQSRTSNPIILQMQQLIAAGDFAH